MASMKDYPAKALVVDGNFGAYTIYALQYNLKYNWDGGLYRRENDGKWGYYSALALQNFLKNRGHYKGKLDGDAKGMTWTAVSDYIYAKHGIIANQPDSWTWPATNGLGPGIQKWMNKVR